MTRAPGEVHECGRDCLFQRRKPEHDPHRVWDGSDHYAAMLGSTVETMIETWPTQTRPMPCLLHTIGSQRITLGQRICDRTFELSEVIQAIRVKLCTIHAAVNPNQFH